MKSTIIRDKDEIRDFSENFSRLCSNPIDLDYFLNADTVRAFYKKGRMVGGYTINSRAPLRYRQMIPEPVRSGAGIARYFDRNDACEITCFWLIRVHLTSQERNNVYLLSAVDALRARKKWIFGGSVHPKLARTQKRVMPNVVYRGPWDFEGSPSGAEVYCARWWQLFALIIVAYTSTSVMDRVKAVRQTLRRRWLGSRIAADRRATARAMESSGV